MTNVLLTCPMCKKMVTGDTRACPRCRADLTILADYANHVHGGLIRAESLTRNGELDEAVWAYLEVLEVDPDNIQARRQIARVATAVRQFDRVAQSQRWLRRLQRQARFRHWLASWEEARPWRNWYYLFLVLLLLLIAFGLGYQRGRDSRRPVPVIDFPVPTPMEG
jgi:hypothetical protein